MNDCVVGVLVPSLAVTVTVTVPVAPAGARSSSTPFCVSVIIEAELIVTGLTRYPIPFGSWVELPSAMAAIAWSTL